MNLDLVTTAIEEGIKYAFILAAGYAAGHYRMVRSKKMLQTGAQSEQSVTIDETRYTKTRDPIPSKLNSFFVNQDIINYDSEVPMSALLPNDVQQRIMYFLGKARKLCTIQNPLIYEHLRHVVPSDEYNNVINTLNRGIVRYLSGKHNRPGSEQNRLALLPVMIGEPYDSPNSFRIILLREDQIQFHSLPKPESLRYPVFEKFQKYFVTDAQHPHADRIDLHRGISVGLANPRNKNLFAARVDLDVTSAIQPIQHPIVTP